MTTNEWITLNYDTLKQMAINISKNDSLYEDLLQDSLHAFLEKPNHQEITDSAGASYYVSRIMTNLYHSTTSPFYKRYKNFTEQVLESIQEPIPDSTPDILLLVDNLHWYDKKLFLLKYVEGNSILKLSKETKISRKSISQTLKSVREHLQQKIKSQQNGD